LIGAADIRCSFSTCPYSGQSWFPQFVVSQSGEKMEARKSTKGSAGSLVELSA